MSQPGLMIRFGKWGQSSQRGSEPRQAPTQARRDGGAAPAQPSRGTQALRTRLAPSYPRPPCHPQRGCWRRTSMVPTAGGRTGSPHPVTAAGRERRLRCCRLLRSGSEGKGDGGPKGDGSDRPTSSWAPSPLSASWKGPRGWDMGAARVPGVPFGWPPSPDTKLVSSCSGLRAPGGARGRWT